MTFEAKKFSDIFSAMRQRAQAGGVITDFEVGSVARTLLESFSYEIALLYEQMHLVYLSAFVDTAEGQQLDMVVSILGITRGEPDFAEGVVTFQRDVGNDDIAIPFGTLVATDDTPEAPKKVYQTVEPQTLLKDHTSTDVRVQALNRGETEVVPSAAIVVMPRPLPGIKAVSNAAAMIFLGKRRETDDELRARAKNALISSGKASVIAIENALLSLPGVRDVRVLEKFTGGTPEYGVIEVFVDGIDFSDQASVSDQARARRVNDTLHSVRAAGIFALLKATIPLEIDSVFRIEITPNLKLSPPERAAFEDNVRGQIASYIASLKMGDPLLLSQITRSILAVEGVNDLVRFSMHIQRRDDEGVVTTVPFNPDTDRRVNSQPSERFQPTRLCVASEDKQLPINITFEAGVGLDTTSYGNLLHALQEDFAGLQLGTPVDVTQLTARISVNGITLVSGTLTVTPKPWCGSVPIIDNTIAVRFVERAVLGDVFAYHSLLKITGALRLTLPASLTDAARQQVQDEVRQKLEAYVEGLPPEADVVLQDLVTIAGTVDPVQTVDVDADDFRVRLNDDPPLPARVGDDKIDVGAFEKTVFEHFCIASSTQVLAVTINYVAVQVTVPGDTPSGNDLEQQENTIKQGLAGKALLTTMDVGEDLRYDLVQDAIEALLPGLSYTVTALEMTGVSQGDGRRQTLTSAGTFLHVRSVEIATVQPLAEGAIAVAVMGTT